LEAAGGLLIFALEPALLIYNSLLEAVIVLVSIKSSPQGKEEGVGYLQLVNDLSTMPFAQAKRPIGWSCTFLHHCCARAALQAVMQGHSPVMRGLA